MFDQKFDDSKALYTEGSKENILFVYYSMDLKKKTKEILAFVAKTKTIKRIQA